LTNLNIDLFPNVDIVADAKNLPYSDSTIDAIFCEAVLEHIREPEKIVAEMYRVLKPGGVIHSFVPFMQGYHGYPHHYQNFTLDGHKFLYSNCGFDILESDVAVGPTYTVCSSIASYMYYYLPSPISILARGVWFIISSFLRPLDKFLIKNSKSHILCAATYLVAKKV